MEKIDKELMKLIEDVQIGACDCETAERQHTEKYKEPAEYKDFDCKNKQDNLKIKPRGLLG